MQQQQQQEKAQCSSCIEQQCSSCVERQLRTELELKTVKIAELETRLKDVEPLILDYLRRFVNGASARIDAKLTELETRIAELEHREPVSYSKLSTFAMPPRYEAAPNSEEMKDIRLVPAPSQQRLRPEVLTTWLLPEFKPVIVPMCEDRMTQLRVVADGSIFKDLRISPVNYKPPHDSTYKAMLIAFVKANFVPAKATLDTMFVHEYQPGTEAGHTCRVELRTWGFGTSTCQSFDEASLESWDESVEKASAGTLRQLTYDPKYFRHFLIGVPRDDRPDDGTTARFFEAHSSHKASDFKHVLQSMKTRSADNASEVVQCFQCTLELRHDYTTLILSWGRGETKTQAKRNADVRFFTMFYEMVQSVTPDVIKQLHNSLAK